MNWNGFDEIMKSNCGYELYWRGCYAGTYNLIAPDSYGHPAKMSVALCFRILGHLKDLGLLNDGDTILDPMSGTGITNICAGAMGYSSISVELEEKFIGFQKQNKEYASRKLYRDLDWTILQGDARKLGELLTERGLVTVSSPPYGDQLEAKEGRVWLSEHSLELGRRGKSGKTTLEKEYGTTPGQIGNLRDTPLKAITSPPYGDSLNEKKNTTSNLKREERLITAGHQPKEFMGGTARNASVEGGLRYSADPANLGNLPDKPLKTVTSPPYFESLQAKMKDNYEYISDKWTKGGTRGGHSAHEIINPISEGQIGQEKQESYLSAMLQVYQEIAKVSDVLAIVLKNPTRNGKLRRLDLDTIEILKQSGWTIHCQHRALLFEELEQASLFGEPEKRVKGRLSFFKRLSWQKGQPVASWEDILICVRDSGNP